MQKRTHKATVFLAKSCQPINQNYIGNEVKLQFVPSVDFASKLTTTPYPVFRNISNYVKMVKPDVLHANSHLFLSSCQALVAANKLRVPSVITIHGVSAERGLVLNALQKIYIQTIVRAVLKDTKAVICLTKNDSETFSKVADPRKISVIPNGVDTELFRPCGKEENLIVWAGRFVPEKGTEDLIEAARIVANQKKHARFLLIGNGPLKLKIVKMAKDYGLIGKTVTFLEPLSRQALAEVFGKAVIFTLPSLREGMSMALLEAMASGNGIVASDAPGINGIIKNRYNGILIPPKNPRELARAILMLLDDMELRDMLASNALKTVCQNYQWDRVIDRLEEVYESVQSERFGDS